jgi:hypothetical protein
MIIEIKIKLSCKPVTAVYSSLFYKQDIVNKSTTYLTGSFGKRKKATFFDVLFVVTTIHCGKPASSWTSACLFFGGQPF